MFIVRLLFISNLTEQQEGGSSTFLFFIPLVSLRVVFNRQLVLRVIQNDIFIVVINYI